MKPTLSLSLRAGERVFINGAVLRVDRKVRIEILNDVRFLLENYVMQAEEATTPLKQLYFIVQNMIIEPDAEKSTLGIFQSYLSSTLEAFENKHIRVELVELGELVSKQKHFLALKTLRELFRLEEKIMSSHSYQGSSITIQPRTTENGNSLLEFND